MLLHLQLVASWSLAPRQVCRETCRIGAWTARITEDIGEHQRVEILNRFTDLGPDPAELGVKSQKGGLKLLVLSSLTPGLPADNKDTATGFIGM